ncbi:hypothetical protein PybrP1_004571 [[Pythium] brassicae (nom. inval.)]|nr:hypothetical protein PybrP1_004571 [[Pythium] brassicae (nom. inval.)]
MRCSSSSRRWLLASASARLAGRHAAPRLPHAGALGVLGMLTAAAALASDDDDAHSNRTAALLPTHAFAQSASSVPPSAAPFRSIRPAAVEDAYEITDEIIGEGGYCVVHRGVDRRTGENVAVKILSKTETNAREFWSEVDVLRLTGTVAYAAPETLMYGAKETRGRAAAAAGDSDGDGDSERGSPQTIMTDGDGLEDHEFAKLGPKTDMFALGVVLYILLCGCHPFDRYNNLTDDEIRKRIIKGTYHTQSRAWKAISAPARDLICKLLETDPAKRLSSEEALAHPWLAKTATLSQVPLRDSAELLEKFQRGRRRLRASIIGVLLVDALDEESKASAGGDTVSDAAAQLTKDMAWGISSSVEAFHEKTQALLSTLGIFDQDNKGFISKTDLARVSEKLGKRMSDSELNEMLVGSTGDPEHDATATDAVAYEDVKLAISTLRSASYAPGETIIREGYAGGHYVYLLLDGEVEVSCTNPIRAVEQQLDSQIFVPRSASVGPATTARNKPAEDEIVLRRLPKGSFFGEIELVRPDGQLHPRVATFRCAPPPSAASGEAASGEAASGEAATPCKVLQLVADDFLNVSGTYASINERMGRCARRHTQQQLIKCVEAAKGAIKKRSLAPGEVVYREGEQCDSFFILLEGEVEVLKQHGTLVVEELHAGDYFPLGVSGQTKQNKISTRHSTVRCTQPTRVVEIGGETFRSFLRSNQFLASGREPLGSTSSGSARPTASKSSRDSTLE